MELERRASMHCTYGVILTLPKAIRHIFVTGGLLGPTRRGTYIDFLRWEVRIARYTKAILARRSNCIVDYMRTCPAR